MKASVLVFITASTTLSAIAWAQTIPPVVLPRIVPTGKVRQVGFFINVNPDCSSAGDVDARIIKQPEHGTVEFEQGAGFSNFKPNTQRYACNTKPVQGTRVKYTSKDGYIGKDAFDVEFLFDPGGDIIWKFAVTVK